MVRPTAGVYKTHASHRFRLDIVSCLTDIATPIEAEMQWHASVKWRELCARFQPHWRWILFAIACTYFTRHLAPLSYNEKGVIDSSADCIFRFGCDWCQCHESWCDAAAISHRRIVASSSVGNRKFKPERRTATWHSGTGFSLQVRTLDLWLYRGSTVFSRSHFTGKIFAGEPPLESKHWTMPTKTLHDFCNSFRSSVHIYW